MVQNFEEKAVTCKWERYFFPFAISSFFGMELYIVFKWDRPSSKLVVAALFVYVIALYFTIYKMELFRNKYKAHIALFVLYETGHSLNVTVIMKLLPLLQTDIISCIVFNLLWFFLISYLVMNIVNHLQLIYWNIYEIEEKSLWKTAVMRRSLHATLPIMLYAIPILNIFKPLSGIDDYALAHLAITYFFFRFCSREGKEASIETKITTFIQNYGPNINWTFFGYIVVISGSVRIILVLLLGFDIYLFDREIDPALLFELHLALKTFLFVILGIIFAYFFFSIQNHQFLLIKPLFFIAQDYFLKCHMDYTPNIDPKKVLSGIFFDEEEDFQIREEKNAEANSGIDEKQANESQNEALELSSILVLNVVETIKTP
ncbi:uncharacterized protein LOC129567400 isoform X1 [Sitodiplosis mosellana]|uniref:uncharacterized protein LOC129567400 isoform X1 n=1 Tax=Sitodiplosis mosellana TaxID=263140 RepID=UPI002444A106|nr:uncharacterized protein LOC129567400 isoform X1 [Sitodiplosis mosellana]